MCVAISPWIFNFAQVKGQAMGMNGLAFALLGVVNLLAELMHRQLQGVLNRKAQERGQTAAAQT